MFYSNKYAVVILLIIGAVLAITSLVGDSVTYDETAHLTAGYSYLRTGDFRLAQSTPPLSQIWAALPLLFVENEWPRPETEGWQQGDHWTIGRKWLFELNDGQGLVTIARYMTVVVFLATCLCIYAIARRLLGSRAALLALALAVFSPTLLAHGRFVTADLPLTLCVLLSLLTFSRFFEQVSFGRWLGATSALSALSLTKFSWPLVVPVLALMAAVAIFRDKPIRFQLLPGRLTVYKNKPSERLLLSRRSRASVLIVAALLSGIVVWSAIWGCFGFRYSAFRGNDRHEATMLRLPERDIANVRPMEAAWAKLLYTSEGEPAGGLTTGFVRWARRGRFLPEAYLFCLADVRGALGIIPYYLTGEVSQEGWFSYFPLAFIIKTPLSVMLLMAAGLAAVCSGRARIKGDRLLVVGLVGFTVLYLIVTIVSRYNIGHRHLVPIYPALMVLAGASACWFGARRGRWLIAAVLVWLVGANLWIHPHYLSYFNELVGGPAYGHLYLADSNIDWGQDIKRLAAYARAHPNESIKISYFGSADPSKYGFECEDLLSTIPFGTPAKLTAGTYVLSVTQMLGVYNPVVTDDYWRDPRSVQNYREMFASVTKASTQNAAEQLAKRAEYLKRARLINRLQHIEPDERIGYSLWVYRLTQEQVDELIRP